MVEKTCNNTMVKNSGLRIKLSWVEFPAAATQSWVTLGKLHMSHKLAHLLNGGKNGTCSATIPRIK